MSYTWTDGELITAEKLNNTGGGGGLTKVATLSAKITQAGELPANSRWADYTPYTDGYSELEPPEDWDFAIVDSINAPMGSVPTHWSLDESGYFDFGFYNPKSSPLNYSKTTVGIVSFYKIG